VRIIVDADIRIPLHTLLLVTRNRITSDLTMSNPQFEDACRHGRWTGNIPKTLTFYHRDNDHLILPRGYIGRLNTLLEQGERVQVDDRTRILPPVDFHFTGALRPYQVEAVAKVLQRRQGVLEMPAGAGKTVTALVIIAARKQPSLVIVHTKELMYQWKERALQFLDLDPDEVGMIGDGHMHVGPRLTVGIVNSLYRCADEVSPHIGNLVVDECHHMPARTFTEAVRAFDARFLLGLSATPYRRDRLNRLIYLYLGDRVHQVLPSTLQQRGYILRARLVVRNTDFDYREVADNYQECMSALAWDPDRNRLIVHDVLEEVQSGTPGIALVISDRVAHCERLYHAIHTQGIETRLMTGTMSSRERADTVLDLNEGKARVLIATASLLGEGFDLKTLSALFLAMPIKFSGRVKQYVGRVLRVAEGKREPLIYDYVDRPAVLQASFKSRCYAYRDLGIEVLGQAA